MAIKFYSGKPGGGKSMRATKFVIETLRTTNRFISTNLALNLDSLAAYLLAEFGETFNCKERIRILQVHECAEFWLHPYQNVDIDPSIRLLIHNKGKIPLMHIDFVSQRTPYGLPGVVFIIDEIHEFFNARSWQETGSDALHYLSQHRKLGDDVICITQSVENVEKVFLRCAQDFTVLKNLAYQRASVCFGLFASPNLFVEHVYLSPPNQTMQKPVETRSFTLDVKGIGSCYDTAAGVGVAGMGADLTRAKKGLPWQLLFVVIGLAMVGGIGVLWSLQHWGPAFMAKAIIPKNLRVVPTIPDNLKTNGSPPAMLSPSLVASNAPSSPLPANVRPDIEESKDVWVTGVVKVPNKPVFVYLSDGRKFVGREITVIGDRAVLIQGVSYLRSRPPESFPERAKRAFVER